MSDVVALVNPPGPLRYLRGGYCCNVSKARYYYPATDLLLQSGHLHSRFRVEAVDSIVQDWDAARTLARLEALRPRGALVVTGSSSWQHDREFLRELGKRLPATSICLTGGFLLTEHGRILEEVPEVDCVLLDFASDDLARYWSDPAAPVTRLATRNGRGGAEDRTAGRQVRYPVPRHEKFLHPGYRMPTARRRPMAMVYQSLGCPYRCDYCIFSIVDYRIRPVDDVMEELRYLAAIGVRELHFYDPTFAVSAKDTMELLEAMIREKLDFTWGCDTRADLMRGDLCGLMKRAGCHTVQIGVETADDEQLDRHLKQTSVEKLREGFASCRAAGLDTLAHVIIGLPGDDRRAMIRTVEFLIEVGADYASFNVASPVVGTRFRSALVDEGLYDPSDGEFDVFAGSPVIRPPGESPESLARLRDEAVRRFYFRPEYLLRRLLGIRTIYQARVSLQEGWQVFLNWTGLVAAR